MFKSGYLLQVTVWGCSLFAAFALGRPCEAQPFDINEDDVAIANNIPILLLSGPFNGWYLQNNFDFEIATAGGNVVPFKIRPDAPTDSLSIADTTGNVGFGIASLPPACISANSPIPPYVWRRQRIPALGI
jgi:hypothetical protein